VRAHDLPQWLVSPTIEGDMPAAIVSQELIQLEKEYWEAIRDKNADAALRLTDNPCIVAGAQGVAAIDHESFKQMLFSGSWTLDEFTLSDDSHVQLLTDDVAAVAYRVTERLIVDGKPVTLEASDTSTWVRRNGRWVCAVHTESIAGDPFGRDRRPST
jgi:uncharacterized protein DUF4440